MKREISISIALTPKSYKVVKEAGEFFNKKPKIALLEWHFFRLFVRF